MSHAYMLNLLYPSITCYVHPLAPSLLILAAANDLKMAKRAQDLKMMVATNKQLIKNRKANLAASGPLPTSGPGAVPETEPVSEASTSVATTSGSAPAPGPPSSQAAGGPRVSGRIGSAAPKVVDNVSQAAAMEVQKTLRRKGDWAWGNAPSCHAICN